MARDAVSSSGGERSAGGEEAAAHDPAVLARVLVSVAAVAIPVSAVAFGFLKLIDLAQEALWGHLPEALGFSEVPWWWALPALTVGCLLLALVVKTLPGNGGHVPAEGVSAGPGNPSMVLPVVLGALALLPFGAVLGPEAPLIAIGSGLAVAIARGITLAPRGQPEALIGLAGAAAAVAAILGNPLVAVVFLVEAVAFAGVSVTVVVIPVLLAVGIGAIVYTGLGTFAGVPAQSLAAPPFTGSTSLDVADLGYALAIGVAAGILVTALFTLGRRAEQLVGSPQGRRYPALLVTAGLGVGASASVYALVTGRSPFDVASSGTQTLGAILTEPAGWGAGALVAVLVFKGLAYGISLGALRGGAIFPAVLLGVALGALIAPLPGLGLPAAVCAGVGACAAAAMRLPLSAAALTFLLFGASAPEQAPTIIIAGVAAFVVRTGWERRRSRPDAVDGSTQDGGLDQPVAGG